MYGSGRRGMYVLVIKTETKGRSFPAIVHYQREVELATQNVTWPTSRDSRKLCLRLLKRDATMFNPPTCVLVHLDLGVARVLPVTGRRKNRSMPFLRALARSEMQTVSSEIWTRISRSVIDDDNRFATSSSIESCAAGTLQLQQQQHQTAMTTTVYD